MMSNAEKRFPILAFAPGNWVWPSVPGSTRYYLWVLAERGWPVIYVEPPKKFAFRTTAWQADDRPFTVLSLGKVPPFGVRGIPHPIVANAMRLLTSAYMISTARKHCENTRIHPKVLWLGAPWHSQLIPEETHNLLVVHHNYDELARSPFLKPFQANLLQRWEEELLKKCDLVLCSSLPQCEARSVFNKNTALLENAVKDSFFLPTNQEDDPENSSVPPAEFSELLTRLQSIPHPRVVYGGVVDHRLDGALLQSASKEFPEANFIFLGNQDHNISGELRQFLQQNYVHILGRIPHDAYPYLYAEADVLIYPTLQTPFTAGMFPDKLGEYLASGKPVVSVGASEVKRLANESREGVIRLANHTAEFAEQLSAALSESGEVLPALRKGLASKRMHSNQTTKLERMLWEGIRRKGISDNPTTP